MKRRLPVLSFRKGFTLVELLVTITIVGILAVVGFVIFSGVQRNARDSKRMSDINATAKAMEEYYNPAIGYQNLQFSWFASGTVPIDPFCTIAGSAPCTQYPGSLNDNGRCILCSNNTGCSGNRCMYCSRGSYAAPIISLCPPPPATPQIVRTNFPVSPPGSIYWSVCANLEGSGGNASSGRAYCKSNQQ